MLRLLQMALILLQFYRCFGETETLRAPPPFPKNPVLIFEAHIIVVIIIIGAPYRIPQHLLHSHTYNGRVSYFQSVSFVYNLYKCIILNWVRMRVCVCVGIFYRFYVFSVIFHIFALIVIRFLLILNF